MSDETRNYKDNVFCLLYQEKKNLLSLYNAMNGTAYRDEEKLEVITLNGAFFMRMRNDTAFVIDAHLNLYEQQSTVNPNMPLRNLYYVAEELKRIMPPRKLYQKKRMEIPAPKFIVFYNGMEKQPERWVYKLSDMFRKAGKTREKPELELLVTVININEGYNEELVRSCESLWGYTEFVEMVRKKMREDKEMSRADAVREAVDECIAKGILPDFFSRHREEIVGLSMMEFDEELYEQAIREEAWEEGMEKVLQLAACLRNAGREQEFWDSLSNKEKHKELLDEFGLA